MSVVNIIVEALRSASVSGPLFNQYANARELDASATAAADRRARLVRHMDCHPRLILLGEAAGYQGALFSGLTFTSERLLNDGAIPRLNDIFSPVVGRITTRSLPFSEPSATIVWRTLKALGIADETVMWNSLPFHPHRPGETLSNRTPTDAELRFGLQFLELLTAHYNGVPVVAVGKKAEEALGLIGLRPAACVRHPANGGATKFQEQLGAFVRNFSFLPEQSGRD